MTTLYLVCGATGAGKTTYALRLCEDLGALHLSIDDWMVNLFGPDAPNPPQWPWIAERLARCERQILRTATDAGRRGLPSVLDLSFLQADQHARAAQAAREAGLAVRLHLLDPDAEIRWARVEARNEAQGDGRPRWHPRRLTALGRSLPAPCQGAGTRFPPLPSGSCAQRSPPRFAPPAQGRITLTGP